MTRTHDLDALLDEVTGNGETVTLFGETWTLPTDVDAETMLRVQRLQMLSLLAEKEGRDPDPAKVLENDVDLETLVERMAGADNYAAWRERGLGYRALQAVAGKLYAIHNGQGDATGKGRKPGQAKRTKTSTGTAPRKPRSR